LIDAATNARLTVNAAPYTFSCDLYGDIVAEKTRMKICAKSGVVEFECEKANAGVEWARLTPPEGTEDWIRARRVKAERDAETRAEIAAERAAEEKRRVARAFLEKQWAIEDAHRASSSPSSPSSSIEMIKKKPSASASMQTPPTNTNTNTSTTRHETKPRSTAPRVPNPRPVALIDVEMTPCQSLPARRPIDPM
jgi:hypothetical protein